MRLQVKTKHHCAPKSYFISLISLLKTRTSLALQKIYEIIGVACGLVLLNFGFELLAAGFPGTRQLTSQFLGISLLVGEELKIGHLSVSVEALRDLMRLVERPA